MTAGRLDKDVHRLDPEALRGLSELVGDPEVLAELADAFLDEAPQRLAELRLGADRGDAVVAGRAAHTLKSNGLTFGAVEFAGLCRQLEVAAGQNDLAGTGPLIDRLDHEWTGVRAELSALRDGGPA